MFSNRLKEFRETLRVSARQFALENDIDARTYNNYEAGTRIPNVTFLEALCFKYGISLDWLIMGIGQMYNKSNNTLLLKKTKDIINRFAKCGQRIMELQDKNNLSNKDMAEIIGISETQYLKICASKEVPTEQELNRLKANFDVDMDWLMYGNEHNVVETNEVNTSFTPEEILKLKNLLKDI